MATVYSFPPVQYTAQALTLEDARSYSRGIQGTPYASQFRQARRNLELDIHGIGSDRAGEAYIEQLRRFLNEKLPLVQVQVAPNGNAQSIQHARKNRDRGDVAWTSGGTPMLWNYQGRPMSWDYNSFVVVYGVEYGNHFVDIVGASPMSTVAFPGERVTQGVVEARVVGVAKSDAAGAARIYVDRALESGRVAISRREFIFALVDSMPGTKRPVGQSYQYTWALTEVFPEDFSTPFDVVRPWR